MKPISIVIIAKNEAANLPRCLESVQWADEVVVVDSGSEDETVQMAHSYGCRVIETEWLGFGPTKNLAVRSASNDWILSLDADEVVSDTLKALLEEHPNSSGIVGYRVKRANHYLGKAIKYCGWQKDYPLRFFNRQFGNFNDRTVHEYVELSGAIGKIDKAILHYSYPDIETHIEKMTKYARLSAEEMHEKGKRSSLIKAYLKGVFKFFSMYVFKMGMLDGRHGFMLCLNSAYGVYLKYAMLHFR